VNGILASGNTNRAIVEMPAWRQVGVLAWAAFSHRADLGRYAMTVHPLEAFTGTILSTVVAIQFYPARGNLRRTALPIYAARCFAIGGRLLTAQAAPIMLSVRHLGSDLPALQKAFDGFEFWGVLRGVCQVCAYGCNLLGTGGGLPVDF
jgi:hypothetical protein